MKLRIEDQEFELTDECIASLLSQMRGVLISSKVHLPIDIQIALTEVNSLTDESLLYLVKAIRDYGLGYYHNLSTPKRLSVMAGVRWLITQIEKKAGEAGKIFRPPRRADPLEHVVSTIYPSVERTVPTLGKVLPYATITLATNNQDITDIRFSLESEGRRQMVADGNVRQWENHSGETARSVYSEALP